MARHRMRLLPVVLGAPLWLSTQPKSGGTGGIYPPRSAAEFATFVALCAERYGRGGSFWRSHKSLPYYPIEAWEIWNEPNLASYWAPKPDARAYVRLLAATYRAVKRVDRHATIVLSGMPFYTPADEASYLTGLYRDGVKRYYDAMGLHTYSESVSGAYQRIQAARSVMNRFGDRRKGIWVTEWGWSGGPPNSYVVSASGQRRNVGAFLSLIARHPRARRSRAHVFQLAG